MTDLIYKESAKLSQDAIIEMFELNLQALGLGTFRFSRTSVDGTSVMFEGQEYPPAPIEASGFQWDGSGPLPRPKLTVVAKDLYFLNMVVDFDDLVGQPVKRIKTFRKYLDDGEFPNTGAKFTDENYVIERKASQNRHSVQFELSTALDQQGVQIPNLRIIRDSCVHKYRVWTGSGFLYRGASCPYAGSRYYKANGEPVEDAEKDACGKRISDCKLRFGENAVLPRLAFPGVGRY